MKRPEGLTREKLERIAAQDWPEGKLPWVAVPRATARIASLLAIHFNEPFAVVCRRSLGWVGCPVPFNIRDANKEDRRQNTRWSIGQFDTNDSPKFFPKPEEAAWLARQCLDTDPTLNFRAFVQSRILLGLVKGGLGANDDEKPGEG